MDAESKYTDSRGLISRGLISRGKSLEITGENLEDLLAYDDLFLDYFNAFLALPVFPQAMYYNRLTGAFEEKPMGNFDTAMIDDDPDNLPYGVTDGERDGMLQWARKERLPLFLSTQLFREFKLCKLLLRPLDDRYSASRGSSHQLRGYSRQSESYVSSLSNSADNSANDMDDEEFPFEGHYNPAHMFKYQRPGSRALSVPAPMFNYYDLYFDEARGSTTTHTHDTSKTASLKRDKSKKARDDLPVDPELMLDIREGGAIYPRESTVTFDPDTAEPESKSVYSRRSSHASRSKRQQAPQSEIEAAFMRHARVLSAPINYDDYMRHPHRDFDMMFGEDEPEPDGNVYVAFEDEGTSEAQTETDVKNMEGRLKMSYQQMKEHLLGSFAAMEYFKSFLADTAGRELVNFWLDCEYFKDSMEKFDEVAAMEKRNRLFRDIQDKFKIHLTKDAIEQISKSSRNANLSHSIFIRTQYDVLRRLRAYWVPRYILHMERETKINSSVLYDSNRWITMQNSARDSMSFFPSINLVSSMPVQPDDVLTYSKTKSWDIVSKGGRRLDERVTSAKYRQAPATSAFSGLLGFTTLKPKRKYRSTKERFVVALAADKIAGGPFERYLACHNDTSLLPNLLFWQDVTDYGAAEDRSADRLLRLCNAWAIFNKYIAEDSPYNIEISADERNEIHKTLLTARDFVEATTFNTARLHSCNKLEDVWIHYLKEDLKTFLDCYVRPDGPTPPGTASIEIILTNDQVLINRPRPWLRSGSGGGYRGPAPSGVRGPATSESQRALQYKTHLSLEGLDEEQRAAILAKRREARKEMERERRKAVRAAYKRLRDAKKKPEDPQNTSSTTPTKKEEDEDALPSPEEVKKEDEMDFEDSGEKKSAKPPPPFQDLAGNKALTSNFKKHLLEQEDKDTFNMVGLFMDIETFLSYGTSKKEAQRREQHAGFIHKTYIDSHGKKKVELSDKLRSKIPEKERPRTPVMKEIQHNVHSKIDEKFKVYLAAKAEEQGIEPGDLVKLSQSELTMRLGNDGGMGGSWRKSRGKGKGNMEREDTYPSVRITISKLERKSRKVHFSKEGTEVSLVSDAGTEYTLLSTSQEESSSTTTPRGPPGSSQVFRRPKRARFGHSKTGRAQPHKDDREEFFKALKLSAAGKMTLPMLYFYKYLLKHGDDDNMPLIDKDLFFYIEVQKFKDGSHQFADEELLRRKVQSIIDCFLESFTSPSVQIDVNPEIHQRTLRAAQRYLSGKDVFSNIFDEAQLGVFKELLPYWAGFRRSFSPPEDPNKKPVTKYQKLLKKRMESIDNYVIPSNVFHLPQIAEGTVAAYTFTLAEGVKLRSGDHKDFDDDDEEVMNEDSNPALGYPVDASVRSSKADLRSNNSKRRPSISHTLSNPTNTIRKENSTVSTKS